MKKIIVAIDGPAGSGKTTTAKLVADKLGYMYIDTGAMYRAVTLACIWERVELNDNEVTAVLDKYVVGLEQSPDGQRTTLNDIDVSNDIRTPKVTAFVSPVSAMAIIREKMVEQQRELGKAGGVVMDGRDIGTVVFKNAELKIFLIASIEARAKRRMMELMEKGIEFTVEEIKQQITDRDHYDSNRENSPLRKADDAVEIDTSKLTIEEQTEKIVVLAEAIIQD